MNIVTDESQASSGVYQAEIWYPRSAVHSIGFVGLDVIPQLLTFILCSSIGRFNFASNFPGRYEVSNTFSCSFISFVVPAFLYLYFFYFLMCSNSWIVHASELDLFCTVLSHSFRFMWWVGSSSFDWCSIFICLFLFQILLKESLIYAERRMKCKKTCSVLISSIIRKHRFINHLGFAFWVLKIKLINMFFYFFDLLSTLHNCFKKPS